MEAKLNKIDELSKFLSNKNALSRDLMSLCKRFRMSKIMSNSGIEKQKGIQSTALLLFLLIIRICGMTKFQLYQNKYFELIDRIVGKNCMYRFVNNPKWSWRSLLYGVAKSFLRIVREKSNDTPCDKSVKPTCFVLDDTTLEKTGITMENISRVFDHVAHKCILGFKAMTLSFFDGTSLIPVDFSLHSEKGKKGDYGLTAKQRRNRFSKKRDRHSAGAKRDAESRMSKLDVAISMMRRAWKHGIRPKFVLMDSWFDPTDFIRRIRCIGGGALHIICMAKNGKRKYKIEGHMHNAKEIIAMNERFARSCRKYHLMYIKRDVELDGMKVRLFLIKYGRKECWNILLTTDLSLSFTKVFEYYQIRWSTEIMYRECKQYLGLGQCQSNDFDAQIADCTLVFVTYTIMALRKRFGEYESMGELFSSMRIELSELTLWQRLLPIIEKLLKVLCPLLGIDIHNVMETIASDKTQETTILKWLIISDAENAA